MLKTRKQKNEYAGEKLKVEITLAKKDELGMVIGFKKKTKAVRGEYDKIYKTYRDKKALGEIVDFEVRR